MAHNQNLYGTPPPQSDEYGNPIRQTDEYGKPIHHGGPTVGSRTGTGYGLTSTTTGHEEGHKLHRSGSGSSSSSSEDDGQGGRRKKGLKEKIKEKLPGTHKDLDHQTHTSATTTPGGGGHHIPIGTHHDDERQHPEKKGIMDKIKEKLPGHQDRP
ncbi:hypothetical protein TIFTF001_002393 [Ficus carica]|uniref:Dehydrin n=1 Tax=Ficus carica TaxID=3494 RepID=A0AA87Z4K5_FICCA|nr:hypothetical protein TIFTF001_002393 [Ficus carica]